MKTYALTLKQKSGLLTELQSDTVYGHFCWRLREKLDVDKLKEFIECYKNEKPIFLLSDGLLKVGDTIRFPRPLLFNRTEVKKTKYEKVLSLVNHKFNKERNYLNLNELNNFLKTGIIDFEQINSENDSNSDNGKKSKKKKKILNESLRVSVQIDRSSFGSMEGRLFSYNPIFPREDVLFVILVKVIDEEKYESFNCKQILKDVFSIGYGKKKSSGYGQFEVQSFQEYTELIESENPNAFMVLGNYLPSENDKIAPIGYDINTKYGKFGEELSLSENPFKNPISFLKAGSCFRTSNLKDFYGRITDEKELSEVNNFAVQFGMPFTLKFNLVT